MKSSIFEIFSETEMAIAAKNLLEFYPDTKIFLLNGNLGAGKTTFVKYICQHLGCDDDVRSPTYSLINEYRSKQEILYHMDLYRLESVEEAIDIGIEDYLNAGKYCFIEWPDIILPLINENYVSCILELTGDFSRKIQCSFHS